jgi:hypothetical protein
MFRSLHLPPSSRKSRIQTNPFDWVHQRNYHLFHFYLKKVTDPAAETLWTVSKILVKTNCCNVSRVFLYWRGTRWGSWLKHCATNRRVAFLIPSDRTMVLGSTQVLTEISNRNISWGGKCDLWVGPTTFLCGFSWNAGASTFWIPQSLCRNLVYLLHFRIPSVFNSPKCSHLVVKDVRFSGVCRDGICGSGSRTSQSFLALALLWWAVSISPQPSPT